MEWVQYLSTSPHIVTFSAMLSRASLRFLPSFRCHHLNSKGIPARGLSNLSEDDRIAQIRAGKCPTTGRSLDEIVREVWGHIQNPVSPGHRSGQKILSRPLKGPLYANWYPKPIESMEGNPITLTEKQERWQKKLKGLRSAGKGPPKKGAGKRSK